MAAAKLPAVARLRSPNQFQCVFAVGRRCAGDCFVLISAANDVGFPRLGMAISKRRARRAVDRNRIKRVVRESFRSAATELPSVDIVVLARSQTVTRCNAALFASLATHWRRLRRTADTQ